jgi:glycosyltransferase involved in cell wall biosynthesis
LKVSAIIPTYNRRTQIFRAIDSVLAQTEPADEIIVVDDGSADGTREAVKAQYGSKVTVLFQENKGVSAARSLGVLEARGQWVAFLDSDDVWLPTKLERQFDGLSRLGNAFGVCFTNCDYFGDENLHLSAFEEAELKIDSSSGELRDPIKGILGTYPAICVQSLVVLRSLFNEVGGFDPALSLAEDRDLIFRLGLRTRFCFIAEPLVRIDRTKSLPRLTEWLAPQKTDQAYAWLELVREKWLANPELTDRSIRQTIEDELVALYYGGASERLGQFRFAVAIQKINKIHLRGQTYPRIGLTLLCRAANKLLRSIRARSSFLPD